MTDITTTGRVLAMLAVTRAPRSARDIADALRLPQGAVEAALRARPDAVVRVGSRRRATAAGGSVYVWALAPTTPTPGVPR